MSGIRLSPKHGVNPMLVVCTWCDRETNEIALLGHMSGRTAKAVGARDPDNPHDKQAPMRGPISDEPCEACRADMACGITFIEVEREPRWKGEFPPRTGRWWVVKREALAHMLDPGELFDSIMESGRTLIDPACAEALGFNRREDDE